MTAIEELDKEIKSGKISINIQRDLNNSDGLGRVLMCVDMGYMADIMEKYAKHQYAYGRFKELQNG